MYTTKKNKNTGTLSQQGQQKEEKEMYVYGRIYVGRLLSTAATSLLWQIYSGTLKQTKKVSQQVKINLMSARPIGGAGEGRRFGLQRGYIQPFDALLWLKANQL